MLRSIKILLVLTVAAFGFVGALWNLIDWAGTVGAVEFTTGMTGWQGGGAAWQATTNPLIVHAGAIFIPLMKVLFAVLCLIGAWRMWQARAADREAFQRAKTFALAGCGLAVWMLFAGWIVIAETWFELWRSDLMRSAALESAFRYAGFIGLIALFVAMRDTDES